MQIKSWKTCTDKRQKNFTDKGHIFYINGMETNRHQNITDKGSLLHINIMQINIWLNFPD